MYSVSNEFLAALHEPARFEKLRGNIGGVPFTDRNIISLNYSNRCSDTADVTLGSCYIGQIEATFTNDLLIPRGDWRGRVISLEWGLVLEDESVEYIPVGLFTITEANWSGTGISIKASDNVSKLDKAYAVSTTSGYIYELLGLAAQECGLTLAQTQVQLEALPNGDEIFGLYPNNDIKTWRDFVGWVCQLFGGFAYADRNGKLAVKSWGDLSEVDSLTETEREYQTTFSDYTTKYDGISVVNIENQTTSYYSTATGGAVINLGSNPFLQYGTNETLTRQRQAIAVVASSIAYTPFNSGVLSNIAYDLGDILTCSGGIAGTGTLNCCVMSIEWQSKNLTTLQGFGADPSLTSGKSKTDKALNGLMSKTSENEVVIHTFENAAAFELEDEQDVEILSIRFATVTPKIVNIWHEIKLDVTADPLGDGVVTCQALYYFDDELIAYSPETSWNNDGYHLLHLLYFLQGLAGGQLYKWEVHLIIKGGTATIDIGDIHASLYGQGLVALDEWDGFIEVYDTMSLVQSSKATFGTINENISLTWFDVESLNLSETISLVQNGKATFGTINEEITVNLQAPIYTRITEEEDVRITEDGDRRITESGTLD